MVGRFWINNKPQMQKILHIPNFFYPNQGGIESTCKYIIEGLPTYEHKVICFSASSSTYSDIIDGINVRRVGSFLKLSSQFISFSYYFELKKILSEYKPDLIHFHAPNPLVMFYLLMLIPKTCKLVVHWHSDIVEQKMLYKFVMPLERQFLKRADKVFTTSPNYSPYSVPLQQVIDKVVVVASAIELDKFVLNSNENAKLKNFRDGYLNKKIVFFIGRHVQYKGLKYLLEAEKYIQCDCLLLIAGSGPLTESLKNEFKSDRIKFLGRLSDEDLKIHLHLADVFAFPSITKNEAFGLVLAESMFCGTPAVTFTIEGSGVNWVSLNNETGIEVENGNSVLFAEAIDKLLSDEALRITYAQNARNRVLENFEMDKIKVQLHLIYEKLLS